ncbi:hypothetical protein [Rubrivirga litoralis]|uniref:Uncharacterized protein n=1 Tax=Rubrivirga litoralis TaxID=3075598 RepID=A0ABU3BMD4_9BACT|nr:hypothetical protein [Rubrivirga sp. F394]MDT0630452.1 hypothetical protein [Rubrivirga sp. F394]
MSLRLWDITFLRAGRPGTSRLDGVACNAATMATPPMLWAGR